MSAADSKAVEPPALDTLWTAYIASLRVRAPTAQRWPMSGADALQACLNALADTGGASRAIWFTLVDSEPVAFEVEVAMLLRAALAYVVSPAGDLMLTTRDLADGICVELANRESWREYEVVSWGAFALEQRGQDSA